MDDSSTVNLSLLPPAAADPALEALTRTGLLDYHSSLGMPAGPAELTWDPSSGVEEISWTARYRLRELLGRGAQGVVYRAERHGVDGYFTHVALKLFTRRKAQDGAEYAAEMARIASQAVRINRIQHDNLIVIRDFVAMGETRVMVMEWVDGLDLRHLLSLHKLRSLKQHLSPEQWARLTDVVVAEGRDQCRLKPGVAVDVIRGCLAGLSALHHQGIVHCDLKPANIMIKRTGTKKIIDVDSSCGVMEGEETVIRGTPYYMAPEQIRDRRVGFTSDVASLGYILIEMLTGQLLFQHCRTLEDLFEAKTRLPGRLKEILPAEVQTNPLLFGLCRKLVEPDPANRFADADAADLDRVGAASFHRQLIKSDLSTEYDRELAWWLEALEQVGGGAGS